MNLEIFIVKRIAGKYKGNLSRPFINIAITSIALGLSVMIISVAILTGFQKAIRNKIIGFGSDIQITNFDANSSYEYIPIDIQDTGKSKLKNGNWFNELKQEKDVRHVQVFGIKAGIIKTKEQIQGVILKGVGKDYDWSFFKNKLVEGTIITLKDSTRSNDVMVSRLIADKLKLKLHDNLLMYFIQDPPRVRKFTIKGIYETGLDDFDKLYVIGDIGQIQRLNNWSSNQVSGIEIIIKDFKDLDKVYNYVYHNIPYNLNAQTIKQIYPEIFDWLDLMDMNVVIIIVIMLMVTGITIICTLLVLILEKTNMIGILKALGIKNFSVRKIFLYNAAYIIFRGLLWGNALALLICYIQLKFNVISLPQESYYVSHIPINLSLAPILLINAGTLIVSILILILPSYIITKVKPVSAIYYR